MKTPITILLFFFSLVGLTLLSSCGKDEEDPIPLVANAGADKTAAPLSTVTLDGSASTGPENFTYKWSYASGDINSLGANGVNSAQLTFIPPRNGTYTFTLRIESNNLFSEDQVTVTVSGALSLPATIDTSITLQDVEPDPSKPDYVASALVTVTNTLNMPTSGSIVIDFSETAGLVVQSGSVDLSSAKLTTSASGWKGILLTGGTLNLTSATIEKGGKSTHTGQTEAAALVMTGGTNSSTAITFASTQGTYDLLLSAGTINNDILTCTFTTSKPYKAPIQYVAKINGTYPANYLYNELTTPGASTQVTALTIQGFAFQQNVKYYISDDFTSGSLVNFQSGSSIFMKAGAGILLSGSSASLTATGGSVTLDGLAGAGWKGIAFGAGSQASMSNITIKNAGSDLFATGSFNSDFKAAVYYASNNNGSITNCQIIDSKGYGVYIASVPGIYVRVSNNTFTNPANAAVSAIVNEVYRVIDVNQTANTFNLNGKPAVEVRSPNPSTYQPIGTWASLGGTNFYLVTGNIFADASWTINAGAILKFKAGKYIDSRGGTFTALGTANQPIIFDSEAGTTGTWSGIVIEGLYKMEYCQVKNGGEAFMFKGGTISATEKANIVFNNSTNVNNTFKNNTISGSAGYGILVEATKQNPDALNVNNNNTFSGNTSGNVIIK